jgi:tRNA-Thr(GGU) m(6)t(6)A37 methyltransferase TsaA
MNQDPQTGAGLTLQPIGIVHTTLETKIEAPRQPQAATGTTGRIELFSGRHFEHALDDLAGWEYLWVIFWFHRNEGWRPKVLPPRSTTGRKGVFATRAPHRPNPLGLSAVRLERIDGLTLHVSGMDMLDGTPVLDIKPYVPYTDAHPAARSGWLDEEAHLAHGERPSDPVAPYEVHFDALAAEQAAWVEQRGGLPLRARITATLMLGPAPHPYRRIRRAGEEFCLGVKDWRAHFTLRGREVRVIAISSGYRKSQLASGTELDPEALTVHREFVANWPQS